MQKILNAFLRFLIVVFSCGFFSPVYSQTGLSKKQAALVATQALSTAFNAHRAIAQTEWGTGQNSIQYNSLTMPFDFKIFGQKPADGRSLYISLHGGGNAPGEVNDQQWQNQHYLYTLSEGIYLVPRAPTNTWNLWHEDHIDNMLQEIIKDAIVMANVNPDKIYLMGYSAGGDGVFQLAPRMADCWAAAAMMAGHPGDANVLNLRNLPFALFVGGADSAYQRNKKVAEWSARLDSLHQADTAGYIHDVHIYPGLPHWMNRNDTIAIQWMDKYRRNALPSKVVWVQDDRHHTHFYWLGTNADSVTSGDKVTATIKNNTISIEGNTMKKLYIYLNDEMLDLDKAITVRNNRKIIFKGKIKRSEAVIKETANARLDAKLIFCTRLTLEGEQLIF